MLRDYRFALSPKWVIGHLVVLAVAVTMTLLGHWQLAVSDRKHFAPQNFGYALQWWAFTIFGLAMWIRVLRDHRRSRGERAGEQPAAPAQAPVESPVGYRRYVMPSSGESNVAVDDTHADYNAYLAQLHERHPSAPDRPQERTNR